MYGTSMKEPLNVANSGTGSLIHFQCKGYCSVGSIKPEPSIKYNRDVFGSVGGSGNFF